MGLIDIFNTGAIERNHDIESGSGAISVSLNPLGSLSEEFHSQFPLRHGPQRTLTTERHTPSEDEFRRSDELSEKRV